MEERVYYRLKKLLEQIKYFLESCILHTWWWSWNHYSAALLAPGEKTDNETIQKPTLKQHGTTYNDKMEPGEQSGTCVFLLTPSNLSDEDWFTEEVGSLCYQRSWKKKNAMAARKDLMLWPNNKVSQIGENVCELQPNQPVCIIIQFLLVMALLLNLLFYLCSALYRGENGGKYYPR